ncbi:MAG: hypothetical protein ACREUQ_14615 [Burkholderiales bacterium]
MADSSKPSSESDANDQRVEDLARELADRLREMPNRGEMTDYAVSLLRDSNEEAAQQDQIRASIDKAANNDPFNPIAFGIPLFVVGAVLAATGILAGPGLGIIALAALMVLYGLGLSLFRGRTR